VIRLEDPNSEEPVAPKKVAFTVAFTSAELKRFDRLTMKLSSLRQMDRITARLDLSAFEKEHGTEKCRAMFEELKRRDAKAKGE
jgi:hypothetical protein